MYLIGLTGGIASGKSVVAARLAEHGAVHIDADQLAREVVEPGTPALAAIAERFGPAVITPDGRLDRAALGTVVFSDEEARLALNAITHPAIRELSARRQADAVERDPHAVIVHDVPLMAEFPRGAKRPYDLVVVVNASQETRIGRLVELRGLSRHEAIQRLNSQASDAERLAIADVVVDSDGTLEHTLEQADALWDRVSAIA